MREIAWIAFYFASDHEGNPFPVHPEMVGSPGVEWTVFTFTAPQTTGVPIMQTSVLMRGEYSVPSEPMRREAEFQLFGAAAAPAPTDVRT